MKPSNRFESNVRPGKRPVMGETNVMVLIPSKPHICKGCLVLADEKAKSFV